MTRFGLGTAAIAAALSTSGAEARLATATLPAPQDIEMGAVHKPTGCRAQVVMEGETLIKASITDPACLPKGITARDVPATLFDFDMTPR